LISEHLFKNWIGWIVLKIEHVESLEETNVSPIRRCRVFICL